MSLLLVFTNPVDGDEEAFNRWYDDVHLDEVLQVPGFVAAERFRLTEEQMGPEERGYRYLAIYEVEGDPAQAFEELQKAAPNMDMSPAMDPTTYTAHFEPFGRGRVSA